MKKRNLIAFITLPVALSLGGCSLFKPRVAQLDKVRAIAPQSGGMESGDPMATGRKMLAAGNYGSAIGAFRLALFQSPESAAAANGLAIAYDGIGRPDLARRYFEQAMGYAPGDESFRRNYQRFASAQDARTVQLASASRTRPAYAASHMASKNTQKLVRLSLGEVTLKTGAPAGTTGAQMPPAEIRLSVAGPKPMLTTPIVDKGKEKPTVMASLSDLTRAVIAVRKRSILKTPILDRTSGCSANDTEAGCAS